MSNLEKLANETLTDEARPRTAPRTQARRLRVQVRFNRAPRRDRAVSSEDVPVHAQRQPPGRGPRGPRTVLSRRYWGPQCVADTAAERARRSSIVRHRLAASMRRLFDGGNSALENNASTRNARRGLRGGQQAALAGRMLYNTFSARVERLAAELPPPIMNRSCTPGTTSDLSTLSIDELLVRIELMRTRLLELRNPPAKSVGTSLESSPIVTLAPPCDVSSPQREDLRNSSEARPVECSFCHQSFQECVDMKEHLTDEWRALHFDDPTERQRRSEIATQTMLKQMGKQSPWL